MRSRLLSAVVVCACALAGPAAGEAQGHDALMPAGARHGLLVDERWVMMHWAPFDERSAEEALSLAPGQLDAFLYNDHHTIAQLARRRGIGFERLVTELTAWSTSTPGADPREIRRRARIMLVSGHLAQHVFSHVFHGLPFPSTLTREAGISKAAFAKRRGRGWSYRRLIAAAGADPGVVEDSIGLALARNERRGIAVHETPPAQARRTGALQRRLLHCWFVRPAQIIDPAAPYGRRYLKHEPGHTAAQVPRTAEQQSHEDTALRRALAARPPSCWVLPDQLGVNPGAPLDRAELRRLAQLPTGYHGPVNDQHDH